MRENQQDSRTRDAAHHDGAEPAACAHSALDALAQARDKLTDILFEIDDIELQLNPQILQEYNISIACYENDLLRAEIEARRAKRKLSLAQAHANRGESVSDTALEEKLEEEFAEWEDKLKEQVRKYVEGLELRSGLSVLPDRDARELKRLHRTLIKRLHPDANIGSEEECERFFLLAQTAYEHGDVKALRSLEVATRHLGKTEHRAESAAEAEAELALVEAQIAIAEDKLNALKTTNPYLLGEKLKDIEWVTETVNDLKECTERFLEARDQYRRLYDELKEDHVGRTY